MRRIAFVLVTVAVLPGVIAAIVGGTGHAAQEAAPVFVKEIPPGYGKPTDEAAMTKCFPCHQAVKGRDFVFTRYAR